MTFAATAEEIERYIYCYAAFREAMDRMSHQDLVEFRAGIEEIISRHDSTWDY